MNRSRSYKSQHEFWLNRPSCDHFARVVFDLAELAPGWQAEVKAALPPTEMIQSLVFVPFQGKIRRNQRKFIQLFPLSQTWEFTPDWLIALTERQLILVRNIETGEPFKSFQIHLENILEMQCGTVLLFAWFRVRWVENGCVRQEVIQFNAVGEPIFTRLIGLIRRCIEPNWLNGNVPDKRSQNLLQTLPYKFMNIIPKRSLLPDEPVQNLLNRPARWKRRWGLIRRLVATQAVVLLTPNALIIAEEDFAAGQSQYGFIHTIYPLRFIRRAWTIQTENTAKLMFSLEWQGIILEEQVDFAPEAYETLAAFAGQVANR